MSRYDWPAPPRTRDDPGARAEHDARLRPAADPASAPPAPAVQAGLAPRDAPGTDAHLWFPIGPSTMTNGQAAHTPNVAGRIRDLQVEPVNGQRIYAASGAGGVWFSADGGASWNPLDDFQQTPDRTHIGAMANALACGSVHVIWDTTGGAGAADGSGDEVWVGTGEPGGDRGGLPVGKVSGIGFLHRAPGTGWTVVNGDVGAADTLFGEVFYRITGDPGNVRQLVAATSNGIYVLPPGGAWTKAPNWPKAGKVADHRPVDVVLTRTGANVRIWVVEYGHLWVAEAPAAAPLNPATLTFTEIHLDNVANGRMAAAAAPDGNTLYLLGLRPKTAAEVAAAPKNDPTPVAHLWSVNSGAAMNQVGSTQLPGVPTAMFMSTGDQSGYDMCIAVHPTRAGLVYVGGAALQTATGWNAALYRCDTTVVPMAAVHIGEGVHSDDHAIRFGPVVAAHAPRRDVWIGCDGGVFHSDSDGDPNTFGPRNDGLAVLQAGYVANHPTNPGIVVAGFQDNGTAVRLGDTVWREAFQGDGGGVAWDPDLAWNPNLASHQVHRFLRQFNQADWSSSDGAFTQPVLRPGPAAQNILDSQANENSVASFYSGADAVSLGPGDTHVAVGTNRVWYSRDWGRNWVTLPTATDPRNGNPVDNQDVVTPHLNADGSTCSDDPPSLPAGIIAVKFASPPVVGTDARLRVISLYPGGLVWLTGTRPAGGTGAFTWTRPAKKSPLPTQAFRAPKKGDETDIYNNGANLKFLPAPGRVTDFAVQNASQGTLGSLYVTTIGVKDFATNPGVRMDTLWFFDGTDTWWPCGLRTDNPNGTWIGTRITAPALGVVVDPADPLVVYVATSVGVVRGVMKIIGGPSFSWTWQLYANGLPEAAVQDLSIRAYGDVRLLRAALVSRGVWETELSAPVAKPLTYLRTYPSDTRRVLPTPLTGQTVVGEAVTPRWDASPDIVVDTTGTTPADPTEPQLLVVPGLPPAPHAAVWLPSRTPRVHVLLHHRWSAPLAPADVKVALLRHAIPAGGVVPLGGLWPVLVAAAPGETPPPVLPDGWAAATAEFWHHPNVPVDTRTPRAVSFDLNFHPAVDPAGTAMVLLAVVMATNNQISADDLKLTSTTNATTVEQLVSSSPHVAAVSIELL